jgi:plastocyanin domain-containing protein
VTDSRQTSGIQKTYASTNDPNTNTLGSAGGCGGGSKPFIPNNSDPSQPQILNNEQTIKATYTLKDDLQPNTFTVKKGLLVNFEVSVSDNGQGCMSTIMIPGLYSSPQYLKQGNNLVIKFTPDKTGDYQITCAMGVPRGLIKVID